MARLLECRGPYLHTDYGWGTYSKRQQQLYNSRAYAVVMKQSLPHGWTDRPILYVSRESSTDLMALSLRSNIWKRIGAKVCKNFSQVTAPEGGMHRWGTQARRSRARTTFISRGERHIAIIIYVTLNNNNNNTNKGYDN